MTSPSSTSSSRRGGVPWALLLTVLLALGVEVGLRLVDLRRVSPYAWGLGEYDASALRLRAEGPPDLLILGTSRAREAFDLPHLHARLEVELGTAPTLGNHGLSGARAGEADAVLSLALRHGHPDLVILGLDPRLLQGTREHRGRQARFAPLSSSWRGPRQEDRRLTAHAHLGAWLRTYGCRNRLRAALQGRDDLSIRSTPFTGGATLFQQREPEVSLASRPVPGRYVEQLLERVREAGRYELTQHRIDTVRRLLDRCATAGVPVLLVEIPMSRAMASHLPMGTLASFQRIAQGLAEAHGLPLATPTDLALSFDERDFYEPSHLNRRGARRLTDAVAARYVVPHLRALRERR